MILGIRFIRDEAMRLARETDDFIKRMTTMSDFAPPTKPIFRPGDVVRLKSGGPNMTVVVIAGGMGSAHETLTVEWFNPIHGKIDASTICAAGAELISTDETRKAEKAAAEKMDKAHAELSEAVNRTKPHLREWGAQFKPDGMAQFKPDVAGTMDEPTPVSDELANSPLVKRAAEDLWNRRNDAYKAVREASSPRMASAVLDMIAANLPSE